MARPKKFDDPVKVNLYMEREDVEKLKRLSQESATGESSGDIVSRLVAEEYQRVKNAKDES